MYVKSLGTEKTRVASIASFNLIKFRQFIWTNGRFQQCGTGEG